jgi:hypothetical protein
MATRCRLRVIGGEWGGAPSIAWKGAKAVDTVVVDFWYKDISLTQFRTEKDGVYLYIETQNGKNLEWFLGLPSLSMLNIAVTLFSNDTFSRYKADQALSTQSNNRNNFVVIMEQFLKEISEVNEY